MGNLVYEKQSPKLTTRGLAMIMIAYTVTLNATSSGGNIGRGLPLIPGMIAILCGWIVLSTLAVLAGRMGTKTRYRTDVIWKYVYGTTGQKIPSLLIAIALVIWMCFDCWYCASAFKYLLPISPHIGFAIGGLICTAATIYGTSAGVMTLKKLGDVTLPFCGIFIVVVIFYLVHMGGGYGEMIQYVPNPMEKMPFITAVNLCVAQYITVTGMWSDVTAEVKTNKAVMIAIPLGMFVNAVMATMGQYGYIVTGIIGINAVAAQIGGWINIVLNILCILAICNSQASSVHMAAVQFSGATGTSHKYQVWCIGIDIVLLLGAFMIEYVYSLNIFTSFASVVGCVIGPSVGVTLTEFWIVRKGDLDGTKVPGHWNVGSILSLIVGTIAAVIFTYYVTFLPGVILAVLFAALARIILWKIAPSLNGKEHEPARAELAAN